MPASNLTDEERAYFHAPRNEAFRKNPNAKYRYIYRKAYDSKYENNNPNAPIVNYGPFSSRMNEMNAKTNSAKTRKNRKNKSRKNRKNRKGNTRRS